MHRLSSILRCRTTLPALSLLGFAQLSFAACSVSTNAVSFGQYDVFSSVAMDSAGTISINCDTSTPYDISLSTGSGTLSQRTLSSATDTLGYNLYTDTARTTVWGDGNMGTSTVGGSTSGTVQHTVYGRVPAEQNVTAGSYSDTVVVTVSY